MRLRDKSSADITGMRARRVICYFKNVHVITNMLHLYNFTNTRWRCRELILNPKRLLYSERNATYSLHRHRRHNCKSHIALDGMENVCAALCLFGLVTLTQLPALGRPRQLVAYVERFWAPRQGRGGQRNCRAERTRN